MSASSKLTQDLLAKIQKAGGAGVTRTKLLGSAKILDKQTALQDLEKNGKIIQKNCGGTVFYFAAESPPLPATETLAALVRRTGQEKGAILWKEADLAKALTKLKHFTAAEAGAAAKAFCGGPEMLELKDGKTKKFLHRDSLGLQADPRGASGYFVSEPARLIYALVELEGECRQRALGLTQAHYGDSELAKQWRKRIAMQIHPDVCRHPKADAATDELTKMFEEMMT